MGVVVPPGRRSVRRFSVEDLLVLRMTAIACGPTMPGTRGRTFMSPAAAFLMVQTITPLRNYIALDDEDCLKLPGLPAFMVVRCFGTDDHCTVDVLDGDEVAEALGAVTNQLLVTPLSRTVYEVVQACGAIDKASHIDERRLGRDVIMLEKSLGTKLIRRDTRYRGLTG